VSQKSEARRAVLSDRIADILLSRAVAVVPLRELAGLLGTSDRMLLYYFGTQAALVTAALTCLSERLATQLEQALPSTPLSPAQLLRKLDGITTRPGVAGILRVWADVAARGARGEAPFQDFAKASVASWLDWIGGRLAIRNSAQRTKMASAILVVIEGVRLLELTAPGTTGAAAGILAKAFDER
jgi:AcrR family transcriptional regulator